MEVDLKAILTAALVASYGDGRALGHMLRRRGRGSHPREVKSRTRKMGRMRQARQERIRSAELSFLLFPGKKEDRLEKKKTDQTEFSRGGDGK